MARKPLTPFQRARETVRRAFRHGLNAADNYAEHDYELLMDRFGLTEDDAKRLREWMDNYNPTNLY